MGLTDYFIFAGVDCRKYGIHAFEKESYGADTMEYNALLIPGRDGDMLVPQNRYPNRDMRFDCLIYEDFYANYERFRAWLLSKVGYQRLECSNHPGEFYLAAVRTALEPIIDSDVTVGKFELAFSRKARRYLKTGERVSTFTSAGSIKNPTAYAAQPLLRVYGDGAVGVGDTTITITAADGYTDIDCELMESFKGNVSKNDKVQLSTNDYPTLKPGNNAISVGTGITRVEITPRWYIR